MPPVGQSRDAAPQPFSLLLWVLPLNCKIKKKRGNQLENPIKDLFLSPGFPSCLLPVLAEPKASCALLKAQLAMLERSEPRTSPGPLKEPQQRGHPLLRDLPHGAGLDSKASLECLASRREEVMEKEPWGRAHSSLPQELGVQRGAAPSNPKSLKVPSKRAAHLSQLFSAGLPEEMLTKQHVLLL